MKRYRVSIYTSVEVNATDEEAAIEEARDEVLSGLPIKECEFSPEEIEPPILFYRAPLSGDQDDEEARRIPSLVVGWEYGFVFMDGAEIWGTVTALTDHLCTIEPNPVSGDRTVPLSFNLLDLKVVYCFGMPRELDDRKILWPNK